MTPLKKESEQWVIATSRKYCLNADFDQLALREIAVAMENVNHYEQALNGSNTFLKDSNNQMAVNPIAKIIDNHRGIVKDLCAQLKIPYPCVTYSGT